MIIHAIRLTNFGLYAGQQAIYPAAREAGGRPVTLIGGQNGRGKTTLLEAVVLALYGSRSPFIRTKTNHYGRYLAELVHYDARSDGTAVVELELALPVEGEFERIRVRRSWQYRAEQTKETLELWRNDEFDAYAAKGWDNLVEELMPLGVASLFFFDGEQIARMAEEDATPVDLQRAIRSLLGLELVERLKSDFEIIKRGIAAEGGYIEDDELSKMDRELVQQAELVTDLEKKIDDLRAEVELLEIQIQEGEQAYLQAGGNLAQNREALQQEHGQISSQLDSKRTQMRTLAASALPMALVGQLLTQVDAQTRAASEGDQARASIPRKAQDSEELLQELVWRGIDSNALDAVREILDRQKKRLEELASQQSSYLLSHIASAHLEQLVRGDGLSALRAQARQLLAEQVKLEERLAHIHELLNFRGDEDRAAEQLKLLQGRATQQGLKQSEVARLEHDLQVARNSVHMLESRYHSLKAKLAVERGAKATSLRSLAVLERASVVVPRFEKLVKQKKLAALEVAVTDALHQLLGKESLVQRVRIDSESFRISVIGRSDNEIPKHRLSSGERQMLTLAIHWGLAEASRRDLPIIIDTPMSRLDASHRMTMVARYLPRASHQVIVLSTDTELVGAYEMAVSEHVGERYLLRYLEEENRTEVRRGDYFGTAGGDLG